MCTAQKNFDSQYIAASEIIDTLGVTRSALMYARKSGRLPEGIVVSKGLLFIWERDKIQPHLDAWKKELTARRGHQ
jgi:hypothetical protein